MIKLNELNIELTPERRRKFNAIFSGVVPNWIECPNCSNIRGVHKGNADYGIAHKCWHCGDDEIDLLEDQEV